eukprot:g31077.t1
MIVKNGGADWKGQIASSCSYLLCFYFYVLETLRESESMDPVTWFPEQTIKVIWQNASLPELSNKGQDIARLVVRRELPTTSCVHA